MSYTVSAKHIQSSVAYKRKGGDMVRIPKLGDATQDQLEELARIKHPGVIKAKAEPKKEEKKEKGSKA